MEGSGIIIAVVACFGVFLALIIVLAVVSARKERERRQALHHWAVRHGWQVVERPQVDWGRRLPGQNRRGVSLALFGTIAGRQVGIAEYSYTRSSTTTNSDGTTSTSTTTYRYVVMLVRLRMPRPAVGVHRRGAMSKFGRSLFGDRATAVGYEPFDSAFRVTAADPTLVRSVLGRELLAEHVAGQLPDWSVEGVELLTYRDGRIAEPDRIPANLAPLMRVADLIEAHARR